MHVLGVIYLNMERAIQQKPSIVTFPVSEWKAYRDLRLRALKNEPQAFLTTYAKAKEDKEE